jgi:predicted phosphodiesterase
MTDLLADVDPPSTPVGIPGGLRIGLLSDIHGNFAALAAVAAALDAAGPFDDVAVAGDLLQGGPRPREVWDLLTDRGWRLVRGNEDDSLQIDRPVNYLGAEEYRAAFLAGTAWTRRQIGPDILSRLAALPDRWRRSTPGGDLLVVHASPRSIVDQAGGIHNSLTEVTDAYSGTGAAAIAFGHYHQGFVRPTPFALLINVASVGLPRDGRALAAYTIVTVSVEGWVVEQRQVPYDREEERRVAAERGLPPWVPDPPSLPN